MACYRLNSETVLRGHSVYIYLEVQQDTQISQIVKSYFDATEDTE